MALKWSLVTKNFGASDMLREKLQKKLLKLDKYLEHFPSDAVHLAITLERHPRKTRFKAGLTLKLPSNLLHGEKEAVDPVPAFDHAFKALLREISTFKSELRGEHAWKGKARRLELREAKSRRFAASAVPEPRRGEESPARREPARLVEGEQKRLVRFVERQLGRRELKRLVGALDAREIVEEVVRKIESGAERNADGVSERVWLYDLARSELKRQAQALEAEARESVSLERPSVPFGTAGDLIGDAGTASPDEIAAQHDLVEFMVRQSASWPAREHAVFELHFLEGFEAEEIAMLEGITPKEAEALIASIQERLRQVLQAATEVAPARPGQAQRQGAV